MNKPTTVKEYFAAFSKEEQEVLQQFRSIISSVVPKAEETISYGMPAFKYEGKMLVYYAAFKNHYSLFPGSTERLTELEEEIKDYVVSKGTLQFKKGSKLPVTLIKKIVKLRAQQNEMAKLIKTKNK